MSSPCAHCSIKFRLQLNRSSLFPTAMATIPYPFVRCEKATAQDDSAIVELNSSLTNRANLIIKKGTRWSVFFLSTEAVSTAEVFENLWTQLGGPFRYLSVAKRNNAMWAMLYKGDQKVVSSLPSCIETVHDIKRSAGGGATRNAIVDFAQAWFASTEITSNFTFKEDAEQEQRAVIENVYGQMSEATEKELQFQVWSARQQKPKERNSFERAILAGQAAFRAIKKEETKRKLEEAVVFRVGENATALEYPRDTPKLVQKRGTTYNPRTEQKEERLVSDYTDTRLHLEKVLVLWGKGGRGKSQCARAIAKYIATGHGTNKYLGTGNLDALKTVQHEFAEYVPVILEELSADDTSQHGRKLSANYLKELLNVPDGGQCRIRNTNVIFFPRQPKILCVNDKPEDWLKAVKGKKDSDDVPLERRLLFVEADDFLIDPKAVEAHESALDEVMQKFKQRRRECNDLATESTAASTACAPPAEDNDSSSSSSSSYYSDTSSEEN